MVILRPTRKLHGPLPISGAVQAASTTALGDWYVNRIIVDRRPLLILVSSTSLLPLLTPARDVCGLPGRLADLVATRLKRLGIARKLIDAELQAMAPVELAPTIDRSVLGIMVDFAKCLPFFLDVGGWDDTTLPFIEARLAKTPCRAGRRSDQVIFPEQAAPALLAARWEAGSPT